jgi:hypothetical protein
MADAGKAALYLRWILEEIGTIMESPTPILADNQGAVRLVNRIPVIRGFAVRVTPIFTSKIRALNTLKNGSSFKK